MWAFVLLAIAPENAVAQPAQKADAVAKARALERWGDHEGALRTLSARVRSDPSDSAARVAYAQMLSADGKREEARSELETAHRAAPGDGAAAAALADLELREGHPDRAEAISSESLALRPDDDELRLRRARALVRLTRFADALSELRVVLAHQPNHAEAAALARDLELSAKRLQSVREPTADSPGAWASALWSALPAAFLLARAQLEDTRPVPPAPAAGADLVTAVRGLALRGDRKGALDLLEWHLEATPSDTDARTLYGTILSWEGRYSEARAELGRVLKQSPGHGDALRAAIHLEQWSSDATRAEALATEALEKTPDSPDLLLERAKARFDLDDFDGALADVKRVLELEPDNGEAQRLEDRIDVARRVWGIGGSYTLDAFSDGRKPWHEATLQVKRAFSLGSVFVRDYQAWRFDSSDNQVELEAFPKIRKGTYADVAVAFATTRELYPIYRVQADVYQSLPAGFEMSLGYRHLQFGSGVNMCVVTAGKYSGDWYFVLRSFITPGVEGTSVSVFGSVRRYFFDGAAYLGLRYGHGLSREELRSLNDIALLSSNSVGTEASLAIAERVDLGLRGSIGQENRVNRDDLWQYTITVSAGVRF
jgi:YaiO family outer membrane protein